MNGGSKSNKVWKPGDENAEGTSLVGTVCGVHALGLCLTNKTEGSGDSRSPGAPRHFLIIPGSLGEQVNKMFVSHVAAESGSGTVFPSSRV